MTLSELDNELKEYSCFIDSKFNVSINDGAKNVFSLIECTIQMIDDINGKIGNVGKEKPLIAFGNKWYIIIWQKMKDSCIDSRYVTGTERFTTRFNKQEMYDLMYKMLGRNDAGIDEISGKIKGVFTGEFSSCMNITMNDNELIIESSLKPVLDSTSSIEKDRWNVEEKFKSIVEGQRKFNELMQSIGESVPSFVLEHGIERLSGKMRSELDTLTDKIHEMHSKFELDAFRADSFMKKPSDVMNVGKAIQMLKENGSVSIVKISSTGCKNEIKEFIEIHGTKVTLKDQSGLNRHGRI